MSVESEVTQQLEATSLKLPPFWTSCPIAWFVQTESQFKIKKITNESTKFDYVIASLPEEVIMNVLDIIQNQDEPNKYSAIKSALINRHSDTDEKKLDKLLTERDTELGDRRPSEFYRYLEVLAFNLKIVSKELVKKLWMRRLPPNLNISLVATGKDDITELITLADKIWDHTPKSNQFIASVSTPSPNLEISSLRSEIDELKKVIQNLSVSDRGRNKCRDCSNGPRNRSRTRSRSVPRFNENGRFCYYHFRFGDKAQKCKEPCAFKNKPSEN